MIGRGASEAGRWTFETQVMRLLRIVFVLVAALLVLTLAALWAVRGRSGSAWWGGVAMTNLNLHGQALAGSLPQSSLLDANGSTVDLGAQIRAAPVTLIVFFATYDAGWSDNVKVAEQTHRDMAKDGVLVIGVDEQEPQGTLTAFVSKKGLTFPVLRDKDGSYLHAIGALGGVEQMVMVDSAGKILARPRGNSDSIAAIEEALRARTKH